MSRWITSMKLDEWNRRPSRLAKAGLCWLWFYALWLSTIWMLAKKKRKERFIHLTEIRSEGKASWKCFSQEICEVNSSAIILDYCSIAFRRAYPHSFSSTFPHRVLFPHNGEISTLVAKMRRLRTLYSILNYNSINFIISLNYY